MDGYSIATHMQKGCHIVLFMLHCATISFFYCITQVQCI